MTFFLLFMAGRAQMKEEAGWFSLDSAFTQTIRIKGADLEKMPFANLSDAIAVWLYGAYTQPAGLIYVVDGNTVSDVNAYSVHDIEEVILVQNAAALMTTASGQQELVLIRTKRHRGKQGMTVAVQSGMVNVSGYHPKAGWYQDVYVGVYHNWDKIGAGVSVDYLRDVFPDTVSGHSAVTPDHLQRWRLNGYFDWRWNTRNLVELTMSYTPQTMAEAWDQPAGYPSSNTARQHLVVPQLYWHSDIVAGLKNELHAIYLHDRYSSAGGSSYPSGDSTQGPFVDTTNSRQRSYHLYLWDRLEYRTRIGHVEFGPALNASYEYCREQMATASAEMEEPPNSNLNGQPVVYSDSYDSLWEYPKFLFLTPSLDISYRRAFDVQGGVLIEAGRQHGPNNEQGFPFVTMTLDPVKLVNERSRSSLRLFGSYARRTVSSLVGYTLTDLSNGPVTPGLDELGMPINGIAGLSGSGGVLGGSSGFGSGGLIFAVGKTPHYGVGEVGASFSTWNDRLLIQYNFERRNYVTGLFISGYFMSYVLFSDVEEALHHVDIRVKVLESGRVKWTSEIGMTLLRNKMKDSAFGEPVIAIGDVAPAAWSETGGWVNRIQVNAFSAGLDVIYHFGETRYVPLYPYSVLVKADGKRNSVLAPNLYLGYGWKMKGRGELEVFVESRGAIRNVPNDLSDGRRYYTVGGKWGW